MKIRLDSPFKSITRLDEIELPSFVVLTGLNGAGKTQLIQAIATKKACIEADGSEATNLIHITGGLGGLSSVPFYGSKLERFCIALQNKISNYVYHKANSPQLTYYSFESFFTPLEKTIIGTVNRNTAEKSKKKVETEPTYTDRLEIMRCIPPGAIIEDSPYSGANQDIFQCDLSQIFKLYHLLQEENDINCYLKDKKGRADVEALSDDEFIDRHGEAPWILANEILSSGGMGYYLTTPENQSSGEPFTAKLISHLDGTEINFSDLSSGEQVLMSLSLMLYNSHYERIYPEVLLLDEPDCHLHPSMAGKLIKIIEEVFVIRRNVKVIMTTHSPSTVALTPEDYLFVMKKDGGRLSKQSKERCIKTLTAGVPALSIDYDNRVQVFVESKYDAKNYSAIYEAVKGLLENEISLNFISSGSGGSGSNDQVREIVALLRRNGNNKIYGVIDWDGKNSGSDFIKVAASGKRYSLENLIFDPLLLGVYLIRELHLRSEDAGLSAGMNYVTLGSLQPSECEKLASYIVDEVGKSVRSNGCNNVAKITYAGGLSISINSWFLEINGHELEEAIKNTFSPLKRFRNENDLKSDILKKVMVDFSKFIPNDFVELFGSIQNQHLA